MKRFYFDAASWHFPIDVTAEDGAVLRTEYDEIDGVGIFDRTRGSENFQAIALTTDAFWAERIVDALNAACDNF